jgi:monovalent cation:H+ antiporter, CPA1 family
MLSITSVLALFLLLVASSYIFFVSKRLKVPYTVMLVLAGLVLAALSQVPMLSPYLGIFSELKLTPEMLFYVFLPILIFESAFNMNFRSMLESFYSILSLSVVALLVSTLLIAGSLYFVLPLLGISIPFVVALLFGAIISSTDPVAVLALFKEYGAPRRLTLMFEGESLFNDGTAVALFLVILGVAQSGFHGFGTVSEGIGVFLIMIILGVLIGFVMALLFSRALYLTRKNEFVSITLLIVSAHLVFIISELINANPIFGMHLHVSSIIATTVSSLFLGNYARHTLSPKSDEYLNKSIEHLAFVANSLVFLMAGMLFASMNIDIAAMLLPILATIVIVAVARAISVFSVTEVLNLAKLEAPIPRSWQYLLAWGSLRGALAIIVVLLIPDDFTPAGWVYEYSAKDVLVSLTIGCILATLFVKAMTIGGMIKKLKINAMTPFQRAHQMDLGIFYLLTELKRIRDSRDRGFVSEADYADLELLLKNKIKTARKSRSELIEQYGTKLFEQSMRYVAIDIEIKYLKDLYKNEEVNEVVYRRIKGKLNMQKDSIEHGQYDEMNPSTFSDRKDTFDRLVLFMQTAKTRSPKRLEIREKYLYYRAQSIIARKVVKVLRYMQEECGGKAFDSGIYKKVSKIYEEFHDGNERHMVNLVDEHGEYLKDYTSEISMVSLHTSGNKALDYLALHGLACESEIEDIEHKFSVCGKK